MRIIPYTAAQPLVPRNLSAPPACLGARHQAAYS